MMHPQLTGPCLFVRSCFPKPAAAGHGYALPCCYPLSPLAGALRHGESSRTMPQQLCYQPLTIKLHHLLAAAFISSDSHTNHLHPKHVLHSPACQLSGSTILDSKRLISAATCMMSCLGYDSSTGPLCNPTAAGPCNPAFRGVLCHRLCVCHWCKGGQPADHAERQVRV